MRVLVTGAAGFAGRHLLRELHEHGHEVAAVVHSAGGPELDGTVEVFEADVRDGAALGHAVAVFEPEGCVHLAGVSFVSEGASDPERLFSVNTGGTGELLEALRNTMVLLRTSPR